MSDSLAFLAQGRLHLKPAEGAPRALRSEFAESVRGRAIDIHNRHAWKTEGRGAQFTGLAWGAPQPNPTRDTSTVTSLTRGPHPGEILYSIDTGGLLAICAYSPGESRERRLLHGSKQRIQDLATSPDRSRIACSLAHPDQTASIALMEPDATDPTAVTEGDSQDRAPAWAQDGSARIVYQSAGVARDARGAPVELGAFEIQSLDLERGEVELLASEPGFDLLCPRLAADGSLYYVRRRRGPRKGKALLGTVVDFLLLPFRLLFAVFQYLNFFSARYTGRPLTTASGPRKTRDLREMLQWANLVQSGEVGEPEDEDTPEAGTLVRRRPDGGTETVATSVRCFELTEQGAIVCASGKELFRLDPISGRRSALGSQPHVEAVIPLDA
jgi:hypothetical protein